MFKILKRITLRELAMIVAAILLIAVGVWLELSIPDYMKDITTLLQSPTVKVKDIYDPAFKMVSLSLTSLLVSVMVVFLSARIAASFVADLRRDVFEQVMDFSRAEISHFSVPSLLTRTTNDIVQIQLFFAMGLQIIVRGPMMAIWAMTKISGKNREWLLLTLGAVLILVVTIVALLTLIFPKQKLVQTLTDKLNGIMRESLKGMRVVRAYNAESYQEKKFDTANTELTDLNLFISRNMSLMLPMMTLVSSGLSLGVYWIGAYLISEANLPDKITIFSDMIVFSSYAMQVVIGFMMMTMIFVIMPRTMVSAKRINEVLDSQASLSYPEEMDSRGDTGATSHGHLVFDHVSFTYPGATKPALEDVSFQADQGQTIAFIGSTGSGKSTLVNLLPRLYDVTEGQITVNGRSIKDYPREALNNLIAYIPQTAILFNGTIDSNLDFGQSLASPLSQVDMWKALDLAQGKDFVEAKEDQLDSHVAQGGANFSGGQKQRLAIARALARKPEFLIFDDSFSALDYKTDKRLRQALKDHLQETTKLIVAQRISTIMDADLILVLDQGKVVGQGSHRDLLASNQIYQEIAYSQLSKEELSHE